LILDLASLLDQLISVDLEVDPTGAQYSINV